jgi:predicted dehydrogenase
MHRIADNKDIDVVYVLTPNALHLENTLVAAKAGKHVFCEKPMEISVERCQQMIDAVKAANRMLGVAYRCQFEPHHLECMRIARDKEFGALKFIDANFSNQTRAGAWRLKRALAGGGPLMDLGIYALQATRYLTGEEPVWISATTTQGDPARFSEVEESVIWQAKFPGGAVSHCSSSYNAAPLGYLRAIAEQRLVRAGSCIQLRRHPGHAQRRQADRVCIDRPVRGRDGRLRPVHHGKEAHQGVRRGRPARCGSDDGHLRVGAKRQADRPARRLTSGGRMGTANAMTHRCPTPCWRCVSGHHRQSPGSRCSSPRAP